MLQVARLAPRHLGEAAALVESFLRETLHADGGGRDRSGERDLYYTVFALDGLVALQADLPVAPTVAYLTGFDDGGGLDLVHLACLARCWAAVGIRSAPPDTARGIARRLAGFRSEDGGFHSVVGAAQGTAYHGFLGLGAYQDLNLPCPDPKGLAASVAAVRAEDGAFAKAEGLAVGSTPVSAAAVTLLRYLDHPVPGPVGSWLLERALPAGGFLAAPQAPMPDLLSTATALHALAGMQVDFEHLREPCLDFLDSLWTGQGFCGHWAEDAADSEYTFYALLALGHLSV